MSIISSYPNDTFTIELKSNGPYIHCKYLKILNNTSNKFLSFLTESNNLFLVSKSCS